MKIARVVLAVSAILLFVAFILFFWIKKTSAGRSTTMLGLAANDAPLSPVKADLKPLQATITLTGKLKPLQVVNVSCPFTGKVERLYFHYGDTVKAGQILIVMDVSDTEVKLREAKAAYIKANENLKQLESWANSVDVARATRSQTKAKLAIENQKKALDEAERLYKKGIIPANEYDSAKQQYSALQMDYKTTEEEMKAVIEKGSATNRQIARLEVQNAYSRMKQLETGLANARIVAPASGIVMKPSGAGKDVKSVELSGTFQQGDVMLAIGDLSGFSVTARVDEVNVTRVKEGQKVRVTGDAFPGLQLGGVVRNIAPQAEDGETRGATSYGITAEISNLTVEQRKRIYIGMSVNLEIVIYEKASAIMLPLAAVTIEEGKKYVLKKLPGTDSVKTLVETGHTTLESVEITKGVAAGDLLMMQRPPQNIGARK